MNTIIFVGNSKKGGISVATAGGDGKLDFAPAVMPEEGIAPLAVHPNQRFLYGVIKTRVPNEIATFVIDPGARTLHCVGTVPVPVFFTYLSVDPSGRNLLGVSYGDGEALVYALAPTGQAQEFPLSRMHVERNPHGVNCSPDGRFVFVPALGQDRVLQYRFDAACGSLTPNAPAAVPFPRNAGPRHMVFSPDRRQAYVLTELSGHVATLTFDAATGGLTFQDSACMLPPERALPASSYTPPRNANMGSNASSPVMWAADIGITPDGRFVYASERRNSTISRFRRDVYSGRLDFAGIDDVDAQPRSFAVCPRGRHMIVAGEKSGTLSVFGIDPATGGLSLCDRQTIGDAPNWVSALLL